MRNNLNWVKGGSSQGENGYIITFDYNPEVIVKLKSTIPAHLREWHPDARTWWVSELCEKQINDCFPGFLEAVVAQQKLF